jgi:hypothetical protein
MATFRMSAEPAKPSNYGGFTVVMDLTGKPDPFPRREVEAKSVTEALEAFDAYKAEAAATGLALAVCIRLKDGSRAPNGWKAAKAAMPFYHPINV